MENIIYLTETILTIQNEVQSAIDYNQTTNKINGTEMGQSDTFMTIGKVDLKLPVNLQMSSSDPTNITEDQLISEINDRDGLLIKNNGDGTGIYSKIKLTQLTEGTDSINQGVLEISMVPVSR